MTYLLYDYAQFLSNYSETTQKNYLISAKLYLRYLKWCKGKDDIITICNVTKSDIYNYVAYLDKYSKGTKKFRIYAVKKFYCFLNQNLGSFLFEDIKLFNNNIKLPKYLISSQIGHIMNYYSNKRDNLIIFLFLNTGIRLSELTNIKIQDVNFTNKTIYTKVKGGHYRYVYINEETKIRILDYIEDRTEGSLFNLHKRQIQAIVSKPLREMGLKGSAHTLRHTFATEMYRKTQDILLVKELLGHKSISSTEIYTHLDSNLLKEAINSNPLANYEVGGKK